MEGPTMNKSLLRNLFDMYVNIYSDHAIDDQIEAFSDILLQAKANGKKVIFAGNGASASIASHGAVDFTKQAKVRAINFNEANLITAFSNDYGYENWVARALECWADDGDVVVLISSSGRSPNVVNAAQYARTRGLKVVTFTGFDTDNPLKTQGELNFWVDSRAYNVIENVHQTWITAVCDNIIGALEYGVTD